MKIALHEYDRTKNFQQMLDIMDSLDVLEIRMARPLWEWLITSTDQLFWDIVEPITNQAILEVGQLGSFKRLPYTEVIITSEIVIENKTVARPLQDNYYLCFYQEVPKKVRAPIDLLSIAHQVTQP